MFGKGKESRTDREDLVKQLVEDADLSSSSEGSGDDEEISPPLSPLKLENEPV